MEVNECERKRKLSASDSNFKNEQSHKKKNDDRKMYEEKETTFHKPENYRTIESENKASSSSRKETELDDLIKELHDNVKKSEERLRKLKMTKMYREKNNLEELGHLTDKWRAVSQQALEDLLELHPAPQPSMTELLKHLQIDFNFIQFNEEDGFWA